MLYKGKTCVIATMHGKEKAIAPSFTSILGFSIVQSELNTDAFGTFSGEIERELAPLKCAEKKCLAALEALKAKIGIASEGSFNPHPMTPFLTIHHEILYFADLEAGFSISTSKFFDNTNFASATHGDYETTLAFAYEHGFPSHGIIVRPNLWEDKKICFKGIQDKDELRRALQEAKAHSRDGKVFVMTDMRAHKNPTRMKNIQKLAAEMADRLATLCPACSTPGFGVTEQLRGLPCSDCRAETDLVRSIVKGCCTCNYTEFLPLEVETADPAFCPLCNP